MAIEIVGGYDSMQPADCSKTAPTSESPLLAGVSINLARKITLLARRLNALRQLQQLIQGVERGSDLEYLLMEFVERLERIQ